MKKIIMMAVMAVLTLTATAQVEKGMRYGISFTGSLSKYTETHGADNIFGYGGGVSLEYNFTPNLYIGTGLQFGIRGTKLTSLDVAGQNVSLKGSLKSYNIGIPVNVGGRINMSNSFALFGQVGPYVSYAIKKPEVQIAGYRTIKGEGFDWGFNGKLGVEFAQFQVYGGYELGMNEVWTGGAKNRSILFGIAYMF